MADINPRKRRLWPFRRRHSDLHLSRERGRRAAEETEVSSSQPSQIRSDKGPLPSVRKLLRGIWNISVRGAGRSPNPAPVGSSSNARNPIPDHIRQDPPADAAPAPEENTGQATNSGTAKVGQFDKTIRIWDAETGKALGAPLQGHTDCAWSVAISPDGTRIVSGSSDSTIRMRDAETGKAFGVPLQGRTDRVHSVAISHNGTRIVSGSADRAIRVWHVESFTHSQAIVCFSSNPTHALCSTTSILPESYMSSLDASDLIPTKERWIVGPEGHLLLWTPSYFPSIMNAPGNTLVIPDALQLNLSHFSHGTSWQMCRKY